ncbi:MAG: phosphoglucosamine mutase [Acidimicrobiales bacterium]|nr:phosphoglucosamine mutase [Acidimicrobiales bacterium]RZV46589.1 MAG: phosphoglucosamine mutase [Acidimicrobiales bacterium]
MSLKFGTDGVRGRAFTELTEDFARALGAAAVTVLETSSMMIGRDTRESGPALQAAFAEGCAAAGASIVDLGVAPTPAVAWMSKSTGQPAAVLSASHNVWHDNGIKIFAAGGTKISDAAQDAIQELLLRGDVPEVVEPEVTTMSIGPYVDAVVASIDGRSLEGTRVVLDCANGAAVDTAATIFGRLGAEIELIGVEPDGRNINDGVGSTYPAEMQKRVLATEAAVGFAFDGDADRVLACGSDGEMIDGDQIIAMAAVDRRDRGHLASDTVVITVMTNLGFRKAMDELGITVVETPVGDRHVLVALDEGGFSLGGEQSGHVIHRDLVTTGDGVLSAIQLLDAALRRGVDIGQWATQLMTRYPQVLENVRVKTRVKDVDQLLAEDIRAEEDLLGTSGRILVRASGTEPLIRVMVEAADRDTANAVAGRLADAVRRAVPA